jgi:hypothetical protein
MSISRCDEEKWEKGRFVEFILPNRGMRVGRILQLYSRGESKKRVMLGLYNPYTDRYGNRGGYRGFTVTVDKDLVLTFLRKSRKRTIESSLPETKSFQPR